MAKTKQGDLLSCSVCGLIVAVDEVCGCAETMVVCCDQPMAKGKLAADRARKKAAVKASPRSTVKAVKAGKTAKGKAKIAPAKAAAKPAVKKALKVPKK
jgi:hypothetical protein